MTQKVDHLGASKDCPMGWQTRMELQMERHLARLLASPKQMVPLKGRD